METVLRAPFRARLRECLVAVGSQVETGAPLLRLEPLGDGGDAGRRAGHRRRRARPARRARRRARRPSGSRPGCATCAACCSASTPARRTSAACWRLPRARSPRPEARQRRPAGGRDRAARGVRRPVRADPQPAGRPGRRGPTPRCTARASTSTAYLQSLDVERAGLPEAFQHRLSQVLRHYGVTDLERTPELEDAVFRIFLAQRRAAADVAVVTALLRQWLTEPPPGEPLREPAGLTLEHLIAATQLRFPAVADLARSVVFRWFAQPLLRRTRAQVYAAVRKDLRYLDAQPGRARPRGADRRDGGQLGAAGPAARAADRPPGRRAGAAAGGADPPLLRQQAAARRADPRGARRYASSSPSTTGRGRPVRRAGHRGGLPGAAGRPCGPSPRPRRRRRRRPGRRHLPHLGRPAGRPGRDGGRAARDAGRRTAARRAPPGHHHGGRAQRRGDAPPLHVPAVGRRDHRGAADPRPAPAHRPADAAGAAAQLRPHPAALGRRGGLPVPLRGPGEPGRRAAGRDGPGA